MLDMYTIKRFINGEIDENEFKENVEEFIANLETLMKKYGERSEIHGYKYERIENIDNEKTGAGYIESARTDLETSVLIEATEKLPKEAAICDMCNNLAHASRLIKADTKRITSSLFGLKTTMIEEIAKECERQGNECYGKGYDSKGRETFMVDIPSYGQIAWHLGKQNIKCKKQYDFEKENTDYYKNCDFLAWAVPEGKMGNHTIKVVKAKNIGEMMQSLYSKKAPVKFKDSEEPII